jgi:hypothetical protein
VAPGLVGGQQPATPQIWLVAGLSVLAHTIAHGWSVGQQLALQPLTWVGWVAAFLVGGVLIICFQAYCLVLLVNRGGHGPIWWPQGFALVVFAQLPNLLGALPFWPPDLGNWPPVWYWATVGLGLRQLAAVCPWRAACLALGAALLGWFVRIVWYPMAL